MNDTLRRTLSRRMRHRSRSVWAATVALVVALVAAWGVIEAALALGGADALVISPGGAIEAGRSLDPVLVAIAGGVIALAGAALLAVAVTPGRNGRRELASDRALIIVDDGVVAGSLSREVAGVARLPRRQVTTSLGAASALVRVRPSAGFAIDTDAARRAASAHLTALGARPAPAVRVEAEAGVLA